VTFLASAASNYVTGHNLDVLGLPYDADGINPSVHPEIVDAFKKAFGIKQ